MSKTIRKPAKRSNKPSNKTAKATTAAKKTATKKSVAHDYAKLFKQAVANGTSSFSIGTDGKIATDKTEIVGAARHGVGSHDRTRGNADMSPKHALCLHVLKLIESGKLQAAVDVKALHAKFKAVKPGTISSWLGNWKRGIARGAFYPSTAVNEYGTAAAVEKLFAKLSK
jgi:hypothetical protein